VSLHDAQKWAGSIVAELAATGPLRSRLLAASFPAFMNLQSDAVYEDYLPERIQKRIDALLVQLKAPQLPGHRHEAVEVTISAMSEFDLAVCAGEMLELAAEVIGRDWDEPHRLHAVS